MILFVHLFSFWNFKINPRPFCYSPNDRVDTFIGSYIEIEEKYPDESMNSAPLTKFGCSYPKGIRTSVDLKKTMCCRRMPRDFFTGWKISLFILYLTKTVSSKLYSSVRAKMLFAHDEVNVHCSPAKKVFFSTIVNFIMSAF